jgi:hypothetical protein
MRYLWIFLGCYALAFAIINFRMAVQRANMDARFKEIGGSPQQLQANIRAAMPLPQEIFIRLWAPLIFSLIPTALISVVYFIFS